MESQEAPAGEDTDKTSEIVIPPGLKDFSERVPPTYISVFTVVKKEDLPSIGEKGLDPSYRARRLPEEAIQLDQEIKRVAGERNKNGLDRLDSTFAYPDHPDVNPPVEYYGDREDQVALELKVDPKSWVADASRYGAIVTAHPKDIEGKIKDYVDTALPLDEYLAKRKEIPSRDDPSGWLSFQRKIEAEGGDIRKIPGDSGQPEVLVQGLVSTDFVRIARK